MKLRALQTFLALRVAFATVLSLGAMGGGAYLLHQELTEGPAEERGPSIAELERADGTVRRKPAHRFTWRKAPEGGKLRQRDSLQTGDESHASILFDDGVAAEMDPNTLVIIDATSDMRLRVLEGSFVLRERERERRVSAAVGGRTEIVELTARLVNPRPLAELYVQKGLEREVPFTWKLVENAAPKETWVEVSKSERFSPALTKKLQIEGRASSIRVGLKPGAYFWRVGSSSGVLSATGRFSLEEAIPLTPTAPALNARYFTEDLKNGIDFKWKVDTAKKIYAKGRHRLELAGEEGFAKPIHAATLDPRTDTLHLPSLPQMGKLAWHIVSQYGDVSVLSEEMPFNALQAEKLHITPQAPLGRVELKEGAPVRFAWNPGVTFNKLDYVVEVKKTDLPDGTTSLGPTKAVEYVWNKYEPGRFQWRVYASLDGVPVGESVWSSVEIVRKGDGEGLVDKVFGLFKKSDASRDLASDKQGGRRSGGGGNSDHGPSPSPTPEVPTELKVTVQPDRSLVLEWKYDGPVAIKGLQIEYSGSREEQDFLKGPMVAPGDRSSLFRLPADMKPKDGAHYLVRLRVIRADEQEENPTVSEVLEFELGPDASPGTSPPPDLSPSPSPSIKPVPAEVLAALESSGQLRRQGPTQVANASSLAPDAPNKLVRNWNIGFTIKTPGAVSYRFERRTPHGRVEGVAPDGLFYYPDPIQLDQSRHCIFCDGPDQFEYYYSDGNAEYGPIQVTMEYGISAIDPNKSYDMPIYGNTVIYFYPTTDAKWENRNNWWLIPPLVPGGPGAHAGRVPTDNEVVYLNGFLPEVSSDTAALRTMATGCVGSWPCPERAPAAIPCSTTSHIRATSVIMERGCWAGQSSLSSRLSWKVADLVGSYTVGPDTSNASSLIIYGSSQATLNHPVKLPTMGAGKSGLLSFLSGIKRVVGEVYFGQPAGQTDSCNPISPRNLGTIHGAAWFADAAVNEGSVDAAFFVCTSRNQGTSGTSYFQGSSVNTGNVAAGVFLNQSANEGNVTNVGYFYDSTENRGVVSAPNAYFADSSKNIGTVGSGSFRTQTVLDRVTQKPITTTVPASTSKVTFSDSSENRGTVWGFATFTGGAINYGIVNGGAKFQNCSQNKGTVFLGAIDQALKPCP